MSTLTSSTSNNNNNNLIINASSPLTTTSSSLNNNNNNNNSSNTINNNNNNISPNTPVSNTATLHHHHPHQSALASGVSSAKRLLPFARSMSSSNGGNTAAGSGAASAGGAAVGSSSIAAGLIPAELNVVLHGYHRKLKTNKKKYFVVYDDTPDKKARLEYFDSEKKFKQSWLKNSSVQAKRSIVLRSCFNINKRHDTKKHVIALYTKDDCFCIVFDSEDELNRWLRTLLSLQRGEESEGEPPRPTFEHVWDVFVQRKGLGDSYGILGNYRLCITDKTLSLVRIGPAVTSTGDDRVEIVEFSLASIRRCGASQRYFYLEVGRSSKTGAGEIWMEAQDAIIAHNMHTTIMKSAKSKDGDSLGPIQRNRSSSANAASKPTQMLVRRQTHTGQKPINCSPSGEDKSSLHASHAQSSESSSSATSTKTVVMVPQNPNSSQNLKANQNQQVNLDKLCTPVTSSPASTSHHPVAGRSQTMGGSPGGPILPPSHHCPSYPSPTPSYCKSSIKKPKLDPPQEEEGSASSPSSYASIRQPIAAGVASTQPVKLAQPTGVPVGVGVAGTLPSASTASVCTSASGSTTITTTEFPSPTDHVTSAVIFHQRALSLPSATPMLSHSPHSNSTTHHHLATQKSSQGVVDSSSNVSSNPSFNGQTGGFFGKYATGGILVSSIQPVHHRTRSLPLTEESAIRVTNNSLPVGPQQHHYQQVANRKHQQSFSLPIASLKCTCPSTGGGPPPVGLVGSKTNHHNLCSQHGGGTATTATLAAVPTSSTPQDYENMNKSCSYLPSSSPPMGHQNDQQHYYSNHSFEAADNNQPAIATPSRSSMESIIEDQKYLPMDMKKPPNQPDDKEPASINPNLQFISRLLRSTNLQTANNSKLSALKMATASIQAFSSSNSSIGSVTNNSSNSITAIASGGGVNHSYGSNSGGSLSKSSTSGSPPATLQRRSGRNSAKSRRSAAIARERCDSLPSRNRTTSETSGHQQQLIMNSGGMPPPRTIPSGSFTRPQSMVVSRQSHSHSPPVYSSPLSPPSTGIYTGSDGSSLSIDETDSFVGSLTPDEGNGFSKVINTLNSGCSIPEENSEEYIHNYGRINQRPFTQHRTIDEFSGHAIRRGSPAPPTHVAGSAEGSGNYMEMCSPCGSSPGDPSGNGGYIPMSPITDFPRGLYTASSSAHSRASSLAEDTVDGYVPMAAPSHTEEYVDMEPSNTSNNRTTGPTAVPSGGAGGPGGGANSNISSAASSCSIISGTPSTDMRFSEYHLEKVVARFTPSEDDEMDRPLRTYSVGSRLEHNKRKLRVDMLSSEGASNSRVRAFSVGSRAKVPRSDLYKGSGGAPITAPLLSAGSSGSIQESTSNSGSITNTAIGVNVASSTASACSGSSCKVGKKSSSAPVLPIKSHGSFDPMDDLMEIDFGTQFQGEQEVSSSTPQKSLGMNDYMEMTASGGCGGDGDSRNSGYVEMKPGHITYSTNTSLHEESDYLDMRPGTRLETNLSTKSTSSPIQITSPKKFNNGSNSGGNSNNSYPQLSPRSITGGTMASSSSSQLHKTKVCSEDYLNVSPLMVASAGGDSGNEDKMMHEEDEIVAPSSAPEGYMEMSWKQTKSSHKPEGSMQASDEYINMDFSRKEGSRISAGIEPRQSSQPIAIQTGGNNRALSGDLMDPKMGGALSNIPNYLPLNPAVQQRHPAAAQIGYNLEQNTVRTRCDSRDSGIVTPSGSQATIFPFSPGSPIKSFPMTTESSSEERKCYVDGTTGTLRISEMDEENSEESSEFQDMNQEQHSKDPENTKLEDLSHNYAELSLGQQQQQQQQQQKAENSHPSCFDNTKRANLSLILTPSTNTRTTPTVTAMKSIIEYPDYVNCSPATTPVAQKPSTPTAVVAASAVFDQAGDYAIMNPASLRKLSSTSQSELPTSDAGLPPLTRKSNLIGFKPITSSQDEALLKKSSAASPKPTFSRQYSERRTGMSSSDTSGYEILQRTSHSRPNSVNSEKIGGKCLPSVSSTTRPNSANSDRLPIISATSSSASSASTLCESKNQSPTASSTMIAMAAGAANRLESAASLTNPSVISRPPSVSSERELHYASLDLPPCGTASTAATGTTSSNRMDIDSDSSAPPSASATSRIGEPDSLNSTPSPNSGCTSQQQTGSAFTYAQIDFVRLVAQSGGNQAPKQTPTKSDQQP
ncbi:mucin-12 isoform X2 [Toxorhynchites rutilus septentrionalis]|uniref:mucin-12 isoform X2 n=1 Tax=Toxorhynchites rutilus septentrionalis TaxID=329112 RepID=UPI0024796FEE|nr:mucin-12 isoform X2 [Toxorhynchites rutilus septentrionalis]